MTHSERDAALTEDWHRLMDACGVSRSEKSATALARLMSAYFEPHRHYHNLDHIFWMLNLISARAKADASLRTENIKLATWYHDVVYDTSSDQNETNSWTFAEEALTDLGFPSGACSPSSTSLCDLCLADRVGCLISMTYGHPRNNNDAETDLFLDADLGILGTDPKTYAEYASAIRKEYAWVADYDYCHGRRKVLRSFQTRDRIFSQDWPGLYTEKQARTNIAAEIAQIDDTLRTLPP